MAIKHIQGGKTSKNNVKRDLESVGASDLLMEEMTFATTRERLKASAKRAAILERQRELERSYLVNLGAGIFNDQGLSDKYGNPDDESKLVRLLQFYEIACSDDDVEEYYKSVAYDEDGMEYYEKPEPLHPSFLDLQKPNKLNLYRALNLEQTRELLLSISTCKTTAYISSLKNGGSALGVLTLDNPNLQGLAQVHFIEQIKTAMDQRVKTSIKKEKNDPESRLQQKINELEQSFNPESTFGIAKGLEKNLRVGLSDKFGSNFMPRGITDHALRFDYALSACDLENEEIDWPEFANDRIMFLLSGSGHSGVSNWTPRGFHGLVRIGQIKIIDQDSGKIEKVAKSSIFALASLADLVVRATAQLIKPISSGPYEKYYELVGPAYVNQRNDFYIETDEVDINSKPYAVARGVTIGYLEASDGKKTLTIAVDGPLGVLGGSGGEPTIEEMAYMAYITVKNLLNGNVMTDGQLKNIEISGFSRGGIACRIFSQLAAIVWPDSNQNILAFDPVSGGGWTMARPIDNQYATSVDDGAQISVIDVHGGATVPASGGKYEELNAKFYIIPTTMGNIDRTGFPVSLPNQDNRADDDKVDVYHGLMNHTGCYVVGGSPVIMKHLACGDMNSVRSEVRQNINDFNIYISQGLGLKNGNELEEYLVKGTKRFNALSDVEVEQMRMCMTPNNLLERDKEGNITGMRTSLTDETDGHTPFTPSNRADMLIDTMLMLNLDEEAVTKLLEEISDDESKFKSIEEFSDNMYDLLEAMDSNEISDSQEMRKTVEELEKKFDSLEVAD